MMIKEIRRELKRQLQEMMQFKFNLPLRDRSRKDT